MIGQTISRYRIVEKRGGGAMGVVYRAGYVPRAPRRVEVPARGRREGPAGKQKRLAARNGATAR